MEKFKDPLRNELPFEQPRESYSSHSITDKESPFNENLKKSAEAGELLVNNNDTDDDQEDDNTDKTVDPPADDDYQRPAKLDLVVGFLRLFNFVSCCTSVFAVVISIFYPVGRKETNVDLSWSLNLWSSITNTTNTEGLYSNKRETGIPLLMDKEDLLFYMKGFAGFVQLFYLLITAVVMTIDSIATVTFRWKEYGELTHRHTDATSILFLISKSRWNLRFIMCLTVCSAASLQTTQIIVTQYGQSLEMKMQEPGSNVPPHALHAVIWYLCLLCAGLLSFMLGYALHLLPARYTDTFLNWHERQRCTQSVAWQQRKWTTIFTILLFPIPLRHNLSP